MSGQLVSGNIPKSQFPTLCYGTRADGLVFGVGVSYAAPLQCDMFTALARYSYQSDWNFTLVTEQPINEAAVVFLQNQTDPSYQGSQFHGQVFNPGDYGYPPLGVPNTSTWEQLYNGASLTLGDGQVIAGGYQAVEALLDIFLANTPTDVIEQCSATFRVNWLMPQMQAFYDQWIKPIPNLSAAPPCPIDPPDVQYPPTAKGRIAQSLDVMIAEGELFSMVAGAGQEVVFSLAPVPTS